MQNRKLIACKLDTYFFLHSHCPSDPEPLWSGLSFCREAHTKEKRERRRKGMAAGMQSNGTAVRGEPQTQKQTEIRGEGKGNVRRQAVAQKHMPADTDMDRAVPDMTSRGHSETIPDVSPIRLGQRLRGRPRMPFRSAPETARPLRKRNPDAVPESRKARRGLRNRK